MELIDPETLVRYMRYRGDSPEGMSLKELADAVTARGVKTSKATIGHLTTGHVKRTDPDRAKAIAKVLDVPVAVLFNDPRVSNVTRDVKPRGRAA